MAKQVIYLGIAALLAILGGYFAVSTASMLEGLAKLLLMLPFAFWAAWQGVWGRKRTDGSFEHISATEPPASPLERTAAFAWLTFRRVVCAVGFVAFVAASVWALLSSFWWQGILLLVFALLSLWTGIVGSSSTGGYSSHLKQDIRSYQERKHRYKWRW